MLKRASSSPLIKISLILALAISISFLLAACFPKGNTNTDRPNIVLIVTDDQPIPTMKNMPTIQKELVEKGVTFTNAFVTTPLCCPSRASILTGLYVHNHKVYSNRVPDGGAPAFDDKSTLPLWLQKAGYRTALIGKYLNAFDVMPEGYIPPGWDDWQVFIDKDPNKDFYYGYTFSDNGKTVKYGLSPKDYSTDVLTQKAVDFIQSSGDQPFFLELSYYAPHQPYISADRHQDLFKTYTNGFERYRPQNLLEQDVSDKPQWVQEIEPQTTDYIDKVYERAMRTLMSVDEGVGRVLAELDRRGIRDNTLVIYMSDNGMSLGDNRVFGKACPYDACIHVPLVVSYPDKITASRVDPNLVLNIDIAPTLTDLAGIPGASHYDGQSFLPLLSDPNYKWRDGFLIEQYQTDEDEGGMTALVPSYDGFRTHQWKYVQYATGERELYDLLNDPFEMNNLSAQPQYEETMQMLAARIKEIKP
jgi:arylsulfatase A-like enzyme